jgi:hypothetical protein
MGLCSKCYKDLMASSKGNASGPSFARNDNHPPSFFFLFFSFSFQNLENFLLVVFPIEHK